MTESDLFSRNLNQINSELLGMARNSSNSFRLDSNPKILPRLVMFYEIPLIIIGFRRVTLIDWFGNISHSV